MAFREMTNELRGYVNGIPAALARTLVNRALRKIYDENTWSFQLGESGWLTPSLVNAGTAAVTVGSTQVVGNGTATAVWNAVGIGITQRQFRVAPYALYNIIAYDGAGTLTLDRPWAEPASATAGYMIYQAYFPAPVLDFRRWLSVRDTTNSIALDFTTYKRADIDFLDPQRTIFQNSNRVVPYETDQRGAGTVNASATLGYMLYELYPHQLAQLPYALYYQRIGQALVNPGDELPFPLTEELVLYRAREQAYEWKEAQASEDRRRGSGADYHFLMGAVMKEYEDRLKDIRKLDRDRVDNFIQRINRRSPMQGPFYSQVTGRANVGGL